MKKIIPLLFLNSFSLALNAANIVDIYGVDPNLGEKIVKNYGAQVGVIEKKLMKEFIKISKGGDEHYAHNELLPKKIQLSNKIKNEYNLAYVQFDTVFYPNDKDIHTTIEVIAKNADKNRLRFITPINKAQTKKSQHDIVEKMVKFHDKSMQLLLNNQLDPVVPACPKYHCLAGFNHPELKNAFAFLSANAPKHENLLINTIKNDPFSERRVAAIYLVGFLNDPQMIISILNDYVMDSDDSVRNSAMRVIAETLNKAKNISLNLEPYLKLLDSPYDTDRNKALYVLLNSCETTAAKKLLVTKASQQLIALLRLKQPNNHEIAYSILKRISKKDFGANDITGWENWLANAKTAEISG